ncbi:hypothetical protein [Clostridium beijerinckii]|nr:hypothetical protein [Clostridium beijerinckii]NOV69006.1 hypothetical protein [Clostridium beijerinckii]NOW32632.1 hypothetical protein [Clostridium beijerinckii]
MKILNLPLYLFELKIMVIQNNDKITICVIIKDKDELILNEAKLLFIV